MFTCKDCDYCIVNDSRQVGCSKFQLGECVAEDDFIELEYPCRDKTIKGEIIDLAKLGYIYIIDNNTTEVKDRIINHIRTIKDPLYIYISLLGTNNAQEYKDVLDGEDVKYILDIRHEETNNYYQIDELSKKFKLGWSYININGEDLMIDAKEFLTDLVYDNENMVMICDKDGSLNNSIINNFVYKFIKGSKPDLDDNGIIIDHKTFIDKITSMAPHLIRYWEDDNDDSSDN